MATSIDPQTALLDSLRATANLYVSTRQGPSPETRGRSDPAQGNDYQEAIWAPQAPLQSSPHEPPNGHTNTIGAPSTVTPAGASVIGSLPDNLVLEASAPNVLGASVRKNLVITFMLLGSATLLVAAGILVLGSGGAAPQLPVALVVVTGGCALLSYFLVMGFGTFKLAAGNKTKETGA